MKTKIKKYPLLISTIVSCVIIIASLFILGFFGLRLGTSLGGGSQFEINVASGASSTEYIAEVKDVLKNHNLTFDSASVEDKYVAIDDEGNYTKQVVVVRISQNNLEDAKESALVNDIAKALEIKTSYISSVENITSIVTGQKVLMLGLAIGIVAIALFVFAWIRYDIFAGLSFIVAFLHNIIVYLALVILTRLELNIISLVAAFILTIIMSIMLIHIYERYRTEAKLHISDKLSISERMLNSSKLAVKSFAIVLCAAVVILAFMAFVPATVIKFTALNILVAIITTIYTTLLIGPAVYVALLEVRDVRHKAVMSRNDEINKVIKKKIKTSKQKAEKAEEKKLAVAEKPVEEKVEKTKVEEKPKTTKKTTSKKSSKSKR